MFAFAEWQHGYFRRFGKHHLPDRLRQRFQNAAGKSFGAAADVKEQIGVVQRAHLRGRQLQMMRRLFRAYHQRRLFADSAHNAGKQRMHRRDARRGARAFRLRAHGKAQGKNQTRGAGGNLFRLFHFLFLLRGCECYIITPANAFVKPPLRRFWRRGGNVIK